jgi:hypothetical protein
MARPPKPTGEAVLKDIARRFGVSVFTVAGWKGKGRPVHDVMKLARLLVESKTTRSALRERALEVLAGYKQQTAEDEAKVEAVLVKTSLGMVEDLEREAARFKRTQEQAEAAGDIAQANALLDARMKVYRTVVSIRRDLRKLGEDTAKHVTRSEVERIIAAMGQQASAAISSMVDAIGKELLGKDRVEQIAEVLEPFLVRGMFLSPFVSAVGFAGDSGLPDWVVDTFRRACGDAIANGEQAFNEAAETDFNAGVGNKNGEAGRHQVQPGPLSPAA